MSIASDSGGPRGLSELISQWERTVADVEGGYPLTFEDYLNDLDLRRTLGEALLKKSERTRLSAIDERFKRCTYLSGECLWGKTNALGEGWTPETHWYYWRLPTHPGAAFRDESDPSTRADSN